jgi:hypothetical protein
METAATIAAQKSRHQLCELALGTMVTVQLEIPQGWADECVLDGQIRGYPDADVIQAF